MVSDASGRRLIAKSAVVSVPLPVLQQGDVKFDPPMPLTHSKAVNALNMGSALKVVVRVNKRFWPDDFYDAVCADCFLPEVWLTPAAELMKPDCPPPYAIVGFVAGKRAERVGKLSDGEIARKMLLQLDAMFGTGGDPHPASDACDGYIVKNWKTHPRIGGAYSHPSLNAHGSRTAMQVVQVEGLRAVLVGDRIGPSSDCESPAEVGARLSISHPLSLPFVFFALLSVNREER